MSCTNSQKEKAAILVIENKDENVVSIEAGKESERNKKNVKKGELATFVWDEALLSHNIEPVLIILLYHSNIIKNRLLLT